MDPRRIPRLPLRLFDGACKGISLYDQAVTIKLRKYRKRWLTLNFPTPKSVGNPSPFGVADATGNGDIQSKKAKAFPPYSGDYSKALVYIKLFNNGKTQIDYKSGAVGGVSIPPKR